MSASGGSGGAFTFQIYTGKGIGEKSRQELIVAIKACEMTRPNLATGDTKYDGSWSFMTGDDTVWPAVYRCMKAHGYQPDGADYTQQTNFGTR